MKITYKTSKRVSAPAILALFRRNEWREWFTPGDTRDLLHYALFVATAWHGRKAVGIATLYGDGRFYAHLDTLLVDERYRRQGIGSALMRVVLERVNTLKPHYCEHTTYEKWLVRFYERLGFERFQEPQLVHRATQDALNEYVARRRRLLEKRAHAIAGT